MIFGSFSWFSTHIHSSISLSALLTLSSRAKSTLFITFKHFSYKISFLSYKYFFENRKGLEVELDTHFHVGHELRVQ